jgi:hypothetical protein
MRRAVRRCLFVETPLLQDEHASPGMRRDRRRTTSALPSPLKSPTRSQLVSAIVGMNAEGETK